MARQALDHRFASRTLDALGDRPRSGWVAAIRGGLGMSQADLARQLDVTPAAIAGLERSEREHTITLGRLDDLADALDCTLVYALVPRTTLADTVQREATHRATESMRYVGRTMELEAQGLAHGPAAALLERETARVIDQHRVWHAR